MLNFTVDGHVVPKGRPRFVRATGHVYTPDKTVEAERAIRAAWRATGGAVIHRPNPVSLYVTVVLPRPRSHYRVAKGREHEVRPGAPIAPTNQPDLDNLVKTVTDALNGMAWDDDSQVAMVMANKEYGEYPSWEITVMEGAFGDFE